LQKDAGDASTKLAKFTKLVDERSKKESRPQVANKLKSSVPTFEKGNQKMVEVKKTILLYFIFIIFYFYFYFYFYFF
jgi:hypothetical protein